MKFSLRKFMFVSILISVVLGSAILARQQAIKVEQRGREFDQLGDACQSFEGEIIEQLGSRPEVQEAYQEILKNDPTVLLQDTVIGGYSGGNGMAQTSGYFWESISGMIDVRYSHQLRRWKQNSERLINIHITSEFDSRKQDSTVLHFRYENSPTNQAIVDFIVKRLRSDFDFEVEYEKVDGKFGR